MKQKNFIIEICPSLNKDWHNNKIFNRVVQITKTDVNLVTNKLSIFCNEDHNCFCDKRIKKDPCRGTVVRGKELGKANG